MEIQKKIKDNMDGFQSVLREMNNWENDMKKKEKILLAETDRGKHDDLPPVRTNIEDSSRNEKPNVNTMKQKDRCSREESLFEKELGNTAVSKRKWLEAISHYSRAIDIFSTDATFYCNRAYCYLQTKRFKQAETDCTIAVQIDNQYAKAYYRRALAFKELDQLQEARNDFAKALEIEPNNASVKNDLLKLEKLMTDVRPLTDANGEAKIVLKESNKNLAYANKEKGNAFVKKKDWSSAIQCYTDACNLYPDEPSFYLNRALCFLKTNEPKKTILDCIRVIEMDAGNIKAYYRRALAYKALGNFDKAHDDLLTAFGLDRSDKTIEEELTMLGEKMGLTAEVANTGSASSARKEFLTQPNTSSTRLTGERFTKLGAYFIEPASKPPYQSSSSLKNVKIADKSEGLLQKMLVKSNESEISASSSKLREKRPERTEKSSLSRISGVKESSLIVEDVDVESLSRPKTSSQFVSSWNKLSNSEQQYRYLKKIDGHQLPSIFGDSLESELFSEILDVLAEKFIGNNDRVYSYLNGLSRVKRISALLLFATEEDKAHISSLLNHAERFDEISKDDLVKLQSFYCC